jgi:hypothetical protein
MQVVVQPAHRILNRNVQIPERVRVWHFNEAPNHWIDMAQSDAESHDSFGFSIHESSSETQRPNQAVSRSGTGLNELYVSIRSPAPRAATAS